MSDRQAEAEVASFKSMELFAGAGGLALGTAMAGFEHVAVLERDANACHTLRRNKADRVEHVRDWEIVEGDVHEYDYRRHRDEVEFVIGGPPCQPFSLGGKHLGKDDRRNLFPEAVRSIREIRPRAFIFENVKGLLRRNFAGYYHYIINQFRFPSVVRGKSERWTEHLSRLERLYTSGRFTGLRYNVAYRLLNAAEYGCGSGVPQRRERVFIVGVRNDQGIEFSFPEVPTHSMDALRHDQWISGEYWDRHRIPSKQRPLVPERVKRRVARLAARSRDSLGLPCGTVRDAITDLPRVSVGQTSQKIANHFLNPGARSYAGHTGSPYDEPAKALKAGDHGVPGGENTLRLEDGRVRYFSVRECARLQTFPDEWTFEGSWTESMRQIGNAVPVRLAELVARRLVDVFARRADD